MMPALSVPPSPASLVVRELGNETPIASVPGEVVIGDDSEWYDFDTKYLAGRMKLRIPAGIPEEATTLVAQRSVEVFMALECAGLARVDSFVTPDGDVIVNEVNTAPGFTPTSAYASLFAASGVPTRELVTRLVDLALDRFRTARSVLV